VVFHWSTPEAPGRPFLALPHLEGVAFHDRQDQTGKPVVILDDRLTDFTGLEFKHNKGGVSFGDSPRTGVLGSQSPTYATHAGPKPKHQYMI
jgi:hypothetical protein